MAGSDYGVFYVEVKREGRWMLVGQYKRRADATAIAKDYRKHGEKARARKG